VDGIAKVEPKLCSGCGMCAATCPNQVITVMYDTAAVLVTCKNQEKGAITRRKCSKGCIGCKKCEKACKVGAIKVENNLCHIDYDLCTGCGMCAYVCPTNAVLLADFTNVHEIRL